MHTRTALAVIVLLAGLSAAHAQDPLPAPPRARTHVLAKGETLWTLAVEYGLSVKALKEANNFDDADHLPAGTAVSLPVQAAYSLGATTLCRDTSEFKQVSFAQPAPRNTLLPEPPRLEQSPGDVEANEEADDAADTGPADLRPVQVSIPRGRSKARSTHAMMQRVTGSSTGFIWPVDGFVISTFGKRRRRHIHAGVDLKAPSGARVCAARDGRVVFSGVVRGHGRVVVLEHDDGYHTVYAHNSKNVVSPERDGDRVIKAGELIAFVGASGNATTPHVHFEIRRDEKPIDPLPFLPAQD